MENTKFSQTQVANFNALAGILAIVLPKLGILASYEQILFVIGAFWASGSVMYSYWQRWQKGDISALGARKA